nr:pectinacetylesterase family protein [Spartinivicinus marinus]
MQLSKWKTLGILFMPFALIDYAAANSMMVDYAKKQLSISNRINKLTVEEQQGAFPLIANPENFNDSFDPKRFGKWQQVELHPYTGATCGNGSPYKFYVNLSKGTTNLSINFEPGGACWDYPSCKGENGIRGARNINGIPNNYMNKVQTAYLTPFLYRNHYRDDFPAQDWTQVFLPYCTGDVHAGDRTVIYKDPEGEGKPYVWHHRGIRNARAVVAWIRENLSQPEQMLTTGCSAGGNGAIINYHYLRRDLQPTYSYMLNDSGPVFNALDNSNHWKSYPAHLSIRKSWGLDPLIDELSQELVGLTKQNLGSFYGALADYYPEDRLAYSHFREDLIYSAYSYERFYPEIYNQSDKKKRKKLLHKYWYQDTDNLIAELDKYGNWGYFFPQYRGLAGSHCTTILEFTNSDIQEAGLEFNDFVDNLFNRSSPLLKQVEYDGTRDFQRPVSWLYRIINIMMGVND